METGEIPCPRSALLRASGRGAGGDPNPDKESVMDMTSNPVLRVIGHWVQKRRRKESLPETGS